MVAGATVSAFRIASPGTMVDTSGLLENAATIMFVVHAMGTTAGLRAHFSPAGMLTPAPPPLHCPHKGGRF